MRQHPALRRCQYLRLWFRMLIALHSIRSLQARSHAYVDVYLNSHSANPRKGDFGDCHAAVRGTSVSVSVRACGINPCIQVSPSPSERMSIVASILRQFRCAPNDDEGSLQTISWQLSLSLNKTGGMSQASTRQVLIRSRRGGGSTLEALEQFPHPWISSLRNACAAR